MGRTKDRRAERRGDGRTMKCPKCGEKLELGREGKDLQGYMCMNKECDLIRILFKKEAERYESRKRN